MGEHEIVSSSEKGEIKVGNLELINRIDFGGLRFRQEDLLVRAIVDEDGEPRSDSFHNDAVLVDEERMTRLVDFFGSKGVMVDSSPWTVADQEDFPGHLTIPLDQLNAAVAAGRVVMREVEGQAGWYEIEELDKAVEEE